MPPKKRSRVSSNIEVPPRRSPSSDGMQLDVPAPTIDANKPEIHDGIRDTVSLWTTDEETILFKGMIRWKPVGMYKHFRMLSLSNYMRSNGFTKLHTRAAGIWKKLGSLYNLETLDEREDALDDLDAEDNDTDDLYVPFKLPTKDFKDLQHAARLDTKRLSSPPQLLEAVAVTPKGQSRHARHSTTTEDNDTKKANTSPANTSERARSRRTSDTRSRTRDNAKSVAAEKGARGGRRSKRGLERKKTGTKAKSTEDQEEENNDDIVEESTVAGEADEDNVEGTSEKPEENEEGNGSEDNDGGEPAEEVEEDDKPPKTSERRRGSTRAAVRTRGSTRGRAQANALGRGGASTRAKGRAGRQKRS